MNGWPLALWAAAMAYGQAPDSKALDKASAELVWTTIRDQHWDPKLNGVDWNAAHTKLMADVAQATGRDKVREAISRTLGLLGQSHFAIIPGDLYQEIDRGESAPNGSAPKAASTRREECSPGFDVDLVDGLATVVSSPESSPVKLGWALRSIDGEPLDATVARFKDAKLHERERYVRSALNSRLHGPCSEPVTVVLEDGAGASHGLKLERTPPKGRFAKFGNLPETRVWIETRRLDPGIGYVRFNLFLDPEQIVPAVSKQVTSCMECRGFIVDLRGNPGGIGVMAMGIAGFFVSEHGQRLGTLRSRELKYDFEVAPRALTFDGPLAILVDGGSASTSEIFAGGLRDIHRARIFGTKTAAAALPSVIMKLPNGDGFQYANANYVSSGGKTLEGNGVTPDETVRQTRAALLRGHDAVIDAAVDWISKQK